MPLLTYEAMAATLVRQVRRTVILVTCKKTSLYTNVWLTTTCPCANFHI